MVWAMIALGGITRLTGSGLSMVSWKPTTLMPPMSLEQWMQAFEEYKLFPEYRYHNQGMTLEEFKTIYYWEYGHRMWGEPTHARALDFHHDALWEYRSATRYAMNMRMHTRTRTSLLTSCTNEHVGNAHVHAKPLVHTTVHAHVYTRTQPRGVLLCATCAHARARARMRHREA